MINTIDGILNIFKSIADRHYMINDFGSGPSSNIGADRALKFPYLWVEYIPNSVILSQNANPIATYSFDILVMDKINKGDTNYQDCMSDTDAIMNTVLIELSKASYIREKRMNFFGTITKSPAQQITDDNVNGWVTTVNVQMPLSFTECSIPINPCTDC